VEEDFLLLESLDTREGLDHSLLVELFDLTHNDVDPVGLGRVYLPSSGRVVHELGFDMRREI